MENEELNISESELLTPEEIDKLVWDGLLKWLNGAEPLPQHVQEAFVERAYELRLRMQAIFLEVQRKFVTQLASDIVFEETLRSSIKQSLPYMTPKEKMDALKTLTSASQPRLEKLEAQMAGFDFFNTVETSMQTLTNTRVSKDLAASVKSLPSERRQLLLSMLNDIVKQTEEEEKKQLTDGTTNSNTPTS